MPSQSTALAQYPTTMTTCDTSESSYMALHRLLTKACTVVPSSNYCLEYQTLFKQALPQHDRDLESISMPADSTTSPCEYYLCGSPIHNFYIGSSNMSQMYDDTRPWHVSGLKDITSPHVIKASHVNQGISLHYHHTYTQKPEAKLSSQQ